MLKFFFFFFQAEDGIRDLTVTGVQTCALPISTGTGPARSPRRRRRRARPAHGRRSEERRVGKSVDLGGRRIIKKKKKKRKNRYKEKKNKKIKKNKKKKN